MPQARTACANDAPPLPHGGLDGAPKPAGGSMTMMCRLSDGNHHGRGEVRGSPLRWRSLSGERAPAIAHGAVLMNSPKTPREMFPAVSPWLPRRGSHGAEHVRCPQFMSPPPIPDSHVLSCLPMCCVPATMGLQGITPLPITMGFVHAMT